MKKEAKVPWLMLIIGNSKTLNKVAMYEAQFKHSLSSFLFAVVNPCKQPEPVAKSAWRNLSPPLKIHRM